MIEPMDIDRSLNDSSVLAEDKGLIEDLKFQQRSEDCNALVIKPKSIKYHNYRISTPLRAQRSLCTQASAIKTLLYYATMFLCIGIICFSYRQIFIENCSPPAINIENFKENLEKYVYGQVEAVNAIEKSFIDNSSFHVTVFVGPTGTGKTYVSNLISAFYGTTENIFRITTDSYIDLKTIDACMHSLKNCANNIIIVDNLHVDDTNFPYFLPILQWKTHESNLKIHVLLIYTGDTLTNTQNILFQHVLLPGTPVHFVHFKKLNHKILDECIKDALKVRGIDPRKELKNIAGNVDVQAFGCKGIYNKIALLL